MEIGNEDNGYEGTISYVSISSNKGSLSPFMLDISLLLFLPDLSQHFLKILSRHVIHYLIVNEVGSAK